jgi:hypothetical protein
MKKLGRNDLCWCGSGKKYKHCHLNRDRQTPPTRQEVYQATKRLFNKKYCLHPEASALNCSGGIIKAHTIQRNGGLSKIARNGHVYCFKPERLRTLTDGELWFPDLIGLKAASTFTGFCAYHDNMVFEPIEKYPFQSNLQHTFLLGYRAVSREYYLKRAQYQLMPILLSLDKGKSETEQLELQEVGQLYGLGVESGLQDLAYHKSEYDRVLISSDFRGVYYYVIRLDKSPEIMCSGSTQVEYDFKGDLLQDLSDTTIIIDQITFSLIATDEGGAAVFNWIGKSKACEQLIKSLDALSDAELPYALVRYVFESFENVFFSPNWWDGLDEDSKRVLQRRAISFDKLPDSLRDDGLKTVLWKIEARKTNVPLN